MKKPRQVRPPSAAIVVAAIHPGARDNLADQRRDLVFALTLALIPARPQPCQNRLHAVNCRDAILLATTWAMSQRDLPQLTGPR